MKNSPTEKEGPFNQSLDSKEHIRKLRMNMNITRGFSIIKPMERQFFLLIRYSNKRIKAAAHNTRNLRDSNQI